MSFETRCQMLQMVSKWDYRQSTTHLSLLTRFIRFLHRHVDVSFLYLQRSAADRCLVRSSLGRRMRRDGHCLMEEQVTMMQLQLHLKKKIDGAQQHTESSARWITRKGPLIPLSLI